MPYGDLTSPGRRLRFMRETYGLTQKALARMVLTSQPAISQWEKDKWRPARATQLRLADALRTSRGWIFDGEPG